MRLHEVDYRVIGGKHFYMRQEVEQLLAALRAIENPYDAIAIIAALRSPFFGISDDEIFKIIMSEAKKRREAIELFEQGGRGDLAAREKDEIAVLESYLPPKLTDEELKALVAEAIKEVEAKDPRDLGKVMKVLMPKVTGRSEGSKVSKVVKEQLTGITD